MLSRSLCGLCALEKRTNCITFLSPISPPPIFFIRWQWAKEKVLLSNTMRKLYKKN